MNLLSYLFGFLWILFFSLSAMLFIQQSYILFYSVFHFLLKLWYEKFSAYILHKFCSVLSESITSSDRLSLSPESLIQLFFITDSSRSAFLLTVPWDIPYIKEHRLYINFRFIVSIWHSTFQVLPDDLHFKGSFFITFFTVIYTILFFLQVLSNRTV